MYHTLYSTRAKRESRDEQYLLFGPRGGQIRVRLMGEPECVGRAVKMRVGVVMQSRKLRFGGR